jgi:5-methyltetrahydrofolate--homocysteine methyltransferase
LATVKGDVHDIGKSIVGVVLQCNNYEVLDLGVMVPSNQILETAIREEVDIIGLSGLITPSLEEMRRIAADMEREGFALPLLIGGATTSRVHTAVKVAPNYNKGPVIHVVDASRAVGVVSKLLSERSKESFGAEIQTEYEKIRRLRANGDRRKRLLTIKEARQRRLLLDWQNYRPPTPQLQGQHLFDDYDLAEISDYIDWSPFFATWELSGKFPAILDDPIAGEAARNLYQDARALLEKIIDEKWLTAKAKIGLFPAASAGDDIEIYSGDTRSDVQAVIHTLRQQMAKGSDRPNLALADFIAPRDSDLLDYLGFFAVTTGIGLQDIVSRFEEAHDDYHAIMAKALADRLAEALAEQMHLRVRRDFWAYVPDESLDNNGLIAERYKGIRPAPGYPACPDHTEKKTIFDLLNVEKDIAVSLTESYAMTPAASVSGFYFSHPESHYFGVGRIGQDQVQDYAARKGLTTAEVEQWLAPNIDYKLPQRT